MFGISKKKKSIKKNTFGIVPIQRSKFNPRHPHVMVIVGDKENITVGLTTKNKRNDLIPVNYSNGDSAFMHRTATRQSSKLYSNHIENFKLDKASENKAYKIAINKMLKDIGKPVKKKKRNR